jgi:CBS domain-containing protein
MRVSHVRIRLPLAIRRPLPGALVPLGADQARDFGLHEGLREHPDALPKDIPILLLEELANKRRQIHSGLRHRVNTSVCLLRPERTHGKMRDGGSCCLRRLVYRISTTCWDSNPSMKLEGVITDRDITVRHVAAAHQRECNVHEHMVRDRIETVGPDASFEQVVEVMQRAQVRRVPVVEGDGRIIGLIAQADIATKEAPTPPQEVVETVEKISEPAHPQR